MLGLLYNFVFIFIFLTKINSFSKIARKNMLIFHSQIITQWKYTIESKMKWDYKYINNNNNLLEWNNRITPSHDSIPCKPSLAPSHIFISHFTNNRYNFSIAHNFPRKIIIFKILPTFIIIYITINVEKKMWINRANTKKIQYLKLTLYLYSSIHKI